MTNRKPLNNKLREKKAAAKDVADLLEQKHAATTKAITNEETETLEQRAATDAMRKEETIDGRDQELLTLIERRRNMDRNGRGPDERTSAKRSNRLFLKNQRFTKGCKHQIKKKEISRRSCGDKLGNIVATSKGTATVFAEVRTTKQKDIQNDEIRMESTCDHSPQRLEKR